MVLLWFELVKCGTLWISQEYIPNVFQLSSVLIPGLGGVGDPSVPEVNWALLLGSPSGQGCDGGS